MYPDAQARFAAEQLRHLEYQMLKDRLGHLFTQTITNNMGGSKVRGVNHLESLWGRLGPHPQWMQVMSPAQLSLLLSFDERLEFRCDEEETRVRPGFVECVLSRLPYLTTCTLSNMELSINHPELLEAPLMCERPFPALRHLDLRRSTISDDELAALVRVMPRLETCDVRGCFNLSWRGVEAARQVASAMGHPPLATLVEKESEHDWLFALYGRHLNQAEGGLLALWREVRVDEAGNFWKGMVNEAQLNMLLHHDTRESIRIESMRGDDFVCGAFQNVFPRLPRLRSIILRDMDFSMNSFVLRRIPNPYPALRELYIEISNMDNRYVMELVQLMPALEVLGLKGCYKVSWRVMELARATGGPKLRVLPETREEKVKADEAALDVLWQDLGSREAQEEYRNLQQEYGVVLRKMESTRPANTNGPWLLWKELGGTHHWRTHLRPTQLTLLLSRDKTTKLTFTVDVGEASASAPASGPNSAVGKSSSVVSGATGNSSWSAITDPSLASNGSLQLDAGEVRAYFSHAVARLPELQELELDACPVWPFLWKLQDDRVDTPFPQLRRMRLRNMTCRAKDLHDLVRHIPSLEKGEEGSDDNGIVVDAAFVDYEDYAPSKLRLMCCGKVSVCHPDGTWHALGDLPNR